MDVQNLSQMESLFFQSSQGIHLLFEHSTVAKILRTPMACEDDFFSFENLKKIQEMIIELINRKTLNDKKNYLEKLDATSYELLVRSYFRILDSTILSKAYMKH